MTWILKKLTFFLINEELHPARKWTDKDYWNSDTTYSEILAALTLSIACYIVHAERQHTRINSASHSRPTSFKRRRTFDAGAPTCAVPFAIVSWPIMSNRRRHWSAGQGQRWQRHGHRHGIVDFWSKNRIVRFLRKLSSSTHQLL